MQLESSTTSSAQSTDRKGNITAKLIAYIKFGSENALPGRALAEAHDQRLEELLMTATDGRMDELLTNLAAAIRKEQECAEEVNRKVDYLNASRQYDSARSARYIIEQQIAALKSNCETVYVVINKGRDRT